MKKFHFIFISFFCFLNLFSQEAKYVWNTPTGEGRQQYVYFRNVVNLSEIPEKAELNVYAYSRYSLVINGEYVNFGPVRSTQKYPYYDTYNILAQLKKGENVIAVKAMNNGINTYQVPIGTAAFIAWGEIREKNNKAIDLSTPGTWLCRAAEGYAGNVQRFSFATGPLECFDARKEPDDWKGENIDLKKWEKPTLLKDQSKFGELLPRIIPELTQDIKLPEKTLHLSSLGLPGHLYNFQVLGDELSNVNEKSVQTYTYIYSPHSQEIPVNLSWGNYWLNGEALEKKDTGIPFQHRITLPLKEGWNLLFGDMEIVFGGTEFMMILPKDKGLIVSADKGKNANNGIAVSGPNAEKPINDPTKFTPGKKDKKWAFVPAQSTTTNPAKTVSWMNEDNILSEKPWERTNIILSENTCNNVLFDMGGTRLGRVFVDIDAPEGALIDITFSETLQDGKIHLYRMYNVNSGVRFISKGGRQHFESFKPYGLRFMQVTVSGMTSPVTLEKAGVIQQMYPFEKLGSFACSDPILNDIWELGWQTLLVCSEDTYTDTPFRERGHYAGDMYPEYAMTLATSGDSRLVKQTLQMFFHDEQYNYLGNVHNSWNDFSAITLLVAAWYIEITNDVEFLQETYPYFVNYLERWYENRTPQGYYHPSGNTFFEWVSIDKKAALTQFQTLMYAVYEKMIYLSEKIGNQEQAKLAEVRADEIKATINTLFWNNKTNETYIDGIDKDGKPLTTKHPNSSAFPMIYGITDQVKDKTIMEYFEDAFNNIGSGRRNQLVTPYGAFYSLAALYLNENAGLAETFMRKHWTPMLEEGNKTAWEHFTIDAGGTLSHAWSGSPTYYLSTQTLGVQLGFPEAYDPDTIIIAPQSETLDWAKGAVPHPQGVVSVSWRISGDNLYLDYISPADVPVRIEPKGRLSNYRLVLNGILQ